MHHFRPDADGGGAVVTSFKVLIVEDEALVAMLVEDMLTDAGHAVVAIAHRLDTGLAAVEKGGIDMAVLDVNLNGEKSFPIAAVLASKGIPFVFATGYGVAGIDQDFAHVPALTKPFDEAKLAAALERAGGSNDR